MTPYRDRTRLEEKVTAQSTETELGALWRQVLRVPEVAPGDNFFELGGDSFRAAQLASLIGDRLGVPVTPALAFDRPELGGQARWIDDARASAAPAAAAPATGGGAALSTQQEEFLHWMFESEPVRDIGSCATAIRIRDALDVSLLTRALEAVIARHEPLRTVVTASGRVLVADELPPEVAEVAASGDTPSERERDAERIVWHERMRLDSVLRGPLVRALVVRVDEDDHVLVLAVHHFAFDGFSLGVMLRELGVVYSALRTGHPSPLRPLPVTYADYCAFAREQWPRNRAYWDRVLEGAPRALTPFPGRRDTALFSRRRHAFEIDVGLARGLRETAQARGATTFMAVAACWTWLLRQWTGMTDLVVMSPVPGRTAPEHEALIGCLVQSLVLRFDASGEPAYSELLDRVREVSVGAVTHQFHSYLETRLRVPFPSRIHYESFGAPHFPGLMSEAFPFPREQEGLDWAANPGELDLSAPELIVEEQRDGSMLAAVVYNHYGYDPETAAELAGAFQRYARIATEHPDRPLPRLGAS
ncbi:condensation domain-containing protein [Streptosporangium amethystogenes]|uniref:condensation domain-containing protein n=1 Tax=Streptosporangium amethystogenes TaxID=2002 RepID=UPI000AAC17CC|nr:condensation domain-containing protein [Streptosporangium amethystogenes]